jgi:purine nucleosidase
MWDVLATAYLGCPDLFSTQSVSIDVSVQLPNEGETIKNSEDGHPVKVVTEVALEAFYEYLLTQFRRNFTELA